nr:probable pre-mRNA-splicing factor ATP-dependent RNA helicase DEAH4 isoform X1 [Ipomoea batatas]
MLFTFRGRKKLTLIVAYLPSLNHYPWKESYLQIECITNFLAKLTQSSSATPSAHETICKSPSNQVKIYENVKPMKTKLCSVSLEDGVAEELGVQLGEEVGYDIRFEIGPLRRPISMLKYSENYFPFEIRDTALRNPKITVEACLKTAICMKRTSKEPEGDVLIFMIGQCVPLHGSLPPEMQPKLNFICNLVHFGISLFHLSVSSIGFAYCYWIIVSMTSPPLLKMFCLALAFLNGQLPLWHSYVIDSGYVRSNDSTTISGMYSLDVVQISNFFRPRNVNNIRTAGLAAKGKLVLPSMDSGSEMGVFEPTRVACVSWRLRVFPAVEYSALVRSEQRATTGFRNQRPVCQSSFDLVRQGAEMSDVGGVRRRTQSSSDERPATNRENFCAVDHRLCDYLLSIVSLV